MRTEDGERIAASLGGRLVGATTLAGGYSHETTLLELDDRRVVARFGGGDPRVEAAVMRLAPVPVPEVLLVEDGSMAIEYVEGVLLSRLLEEPPADVDLAALGREVGRVIARIGEVRFDAPGFFADASLATHPQPPWSEQLVPFVEQCMGKTERLDERERKAFVALCAEHAPELVAIDGEARLAHGDVNPKNILIDGPRVAAVLDWEFAYVGSPYADAANMARFGADYPPAFLAGFDEGFEAHEPRHPDWRRLGRLMDLFALADLVTRPASNVVADQAAAIIRSLQDVHL